MFAPPGAVDRVAQEWRKHRVLSKFDHIVYKTVPLSHCPAVPHAEFLPSTRNSNFVISGPRAQKSGANAAVSYIAQRCKYCQRKRAAPGSEYAFRMVPHCGKIDLPYQ